MLLLTRNDIKKVFSMEEAIEADKKAFMIFSTGGSVTPLRTNISVPKYGGQALFMPGYVEALDSAGLKIVSVFPGNSAKGKPSVPATMLLVDGTTGEVSAVLDGTYVTQLRTGAATGVATQILARKEARIGALIGAGGQAATQLEAMLTVRDLAEVRIFGADREQAKAFIAAMTTELNHFKAQLRYTDSASEAVDGADIITTVTTSKHPVFDGRLVKQGAHINAIGSYMPIMQELDEHIVVRADKVYCESREVALAEAGDFIVPLQKGLITPEKITGEIGLLISGSVPGRESEDEITLFKSVGVAVVDIVTAYDIYQKAMQQGVGVQFDFN